MLSQRLVKACVLRVLDRGSAGHAEQIDDATRQIDANIAALAKSVSRPTFGDLLDAVAAAWTELQTLAATALVAGGLAALDDAAEQLLVQADKLTRGLETAGLVTTLHVINVSGRQRMLSQRYAKEALLGLVLEGDDARAVGASLRRTAETFEQALEHLRGVPLSTGEIRALLGDAERVWHDVAAAARHVGSASGARALDASSDALLALFEQLTDRYERSMQVLMG